MTDAEVMIRLEGLEKKYPGQKQPAVSELTLEIPKGEIVILVGPSGCGKTTTLKMINRVIEPTGGRILLEGDDVTDADPDKLRRRIGYVIQQIGLFPHMTIGQNIALVPGLLKWDKSRVNRRVDELLDLVGMDPAKYRQRYPKELSGGQRQRVGVARALSADPPVMLMDEPFGAIDPITRDRLQNEFLRLQEEIKKTIVFVTHDIDEAIKMGDRIAILRDESRIAQYDKPEHILSDPADSFVEDFIGHGASLKGLNLKRVRDVELANWPTSPQTATRGEVLEALRRSDQGAVLLLDEQRRPRRWVDARSLDRTDKPLMETGLPPEAIVSPGTTLSDALNEMLKSRVACAIVVDDSGAYAGAVDIDTIMESIQAMRVAARDESRALAGADMTGDSS
ncbi:MAG: betaine/proline/choline family ABC transporter ATP-binding protein [Actinobacteria bacterium]|jgi:osmoprotectant transport system ATP-binding protein|nr:betaine/proline/choline family ABC transporter ATP-binding protein [Actinomycetota bacterium]